MPNKGQTLRTGAREIISHVIEVCDQEAANNKFEISVRSKTARAAFYTGVSDRTILRIRQEDKKRKAETPSELLRSPGKKRTRLGVSDKVDDFDFEVIRRTIQEFYLNMKSVPTSFKLLCKIREEINFPWGSKTLNKLLREKGFAWRKCQNRKNVLMEKPHMLLKRHNYLQRVRQYRLQNIPLIYIGETWIDNNTAVKSVKKCEEPKVSGIGRLNILHAASAKGFVQGAELVFPSRLTTSDFEEWLCERLFPNIPSSSVIILNNAPYHLEISNKAPSKYAPKAAMSLWLSQNNISHDPEMRKLDLWDLIAKNKPQGKRYKVDQLIASYGHTSLRLPPYICGLNPVELAWADIKRYISESNSLSQVTQLTYEACASITEDKWQSYTKYVISVEANYWEVDGKIEATVDEIAGKDDSSDDEIPSSDESSSDDCLEEPITEIVIKEEKLFSEAGTSSTS